MPKKARDGADSRSDESNTAREPALSEDVHSAKEPGLSEGSRTAKEPQLSEDVHSAKEPGKKELEILKREREAIEGVEEFDMATPEAIAHSDPASEAALRLARSKK
ncbi:hypothetical protein QR680_012522 [Steinernema hermaphroditum]|uniref:Uncharacterized protein n=1 Tax=Steinernema hermaphroditum TaxID=289476 RepID=A0AA39M0M6_9BILA|nr:hypothetical protein QR680_012522 [Steinernema hermaphroditum]